MPVDGAFAAGRAESQPAVGFDGVGRGVYRDPGDGRIGTALVTECAEQGAGNALPVVCLLHEKEAYMVVARQGDNPGEHSLPESTPRQHRTVAVLCREGRRFDKAEECGDAFRAVFRGFELGEDAPCEGCCCR